MSQARLSLTVAQSTTLVTLDTARAVLGMDNDSVAALCESGSLQYAFDLRSNTADRREVRIWADSLDAYKRGIRLESDDHAALVFCNERGARREASATRTTTTAARTG